jgi:serine/threonine protein kinase/tetratricopeptide (TPR) repeat protein
METLGPYRVLAKLGEGGMGIVYSALDGRGERVALKVIRDSSQDPLTRKRFEREARLASSLDHPGVCRIIDIGEADGAPYIAMELLEGESLAERMKRGALPMADTVNLGLGVLGALGAIHDSGLVHRDLKPSNVFLTGSGPKLLDFGLARPVAVADPKDGLTQSVVTQKGEILGTPHYMAPEQIAGGAIDARTDLFAMASMLFEMAAGRPAFRGRTVMEVLHATLYEQPPALGGSASAATLDRIIRRGLAKAAEDRPASAAAMATDLASALVANDTGALPRVVAMTRLMVLPFRILRPDPETDFLAFSLPDAITTSLSGLSALVVRSSVAAARFGGDSPDFRRMATEADVDVVVTGTLLRSGERVRVTTQLVEAPAGTLLWSQSTQVTLTDIFELEDGLVHRIVEALALPLTAREHRLLAQDVPESTKAYEYYLRGNQLSLDSNSWGVARDLYLQCVEEAPRYAPAWARLGRVHRLLAKFATRRSPELEQKADRAFQRALDLNPELALAHSLYAQFEVEAGRPKDAMVRLLGRAHAAGPQLDLYVGLVHACRYCGLLEASVAAHENARRLDPQVRTSVNFTYLAQGQYERAIAADEPGNIFGTSNYALGALGRKDEVLEMCREMEPKVLGAERELLRLQRGGVERDPVAIRKVMSSLMTAMRDPEGIYFGVRALAFVGLHEEALGHFERVVEGGYFCVPHFHNDPWLRDLRAHQGFAALIGRAEALYAEARRAFEDSSGPALLGVTAG